MHNQQQIIQKLLPLIVLQQTFQQMLPEWLTLITMLPERNDVSVNFVSE